MTNHLIITVASYLLHCDEFDAAAGRKRNLMKNSVDKVRFIIHLKHTSRLCHNTFSFLVSQGATLLAQSPFFTKIMGISLHTRSVKDFILRKVRLSHQSSLHDILQFSSSEKPTSSTSQIQNVPMIIWRRCIFMQSHSVLQCD